MGTRLDRAMRGTTGAASHRFGWLFLIAGALALLVQPGSPIQAQASGARYEGVATCAGSTCHGRAEGNGEVVRQDEIATWQEPSSAAGSHSRAFAVLASPRGKQIAASLGLGPATSAPACLGCHATYEPGTAKGERFQISDGVGCESCHGPSSTWLASHYAKPATHASNVANGLVPLDRPQTRAKVCLDCHFGSDKPGQFVSHRMMAAGHPRMSFELDLFNSYQNHARSRSVSGVTSWAVGQAMALERSLTLFTSARGSEGVFPEFYFFDCHSCHRAISDDKNPPVRFGANPGRPIVWGAPPYNDENMILLNAAAMFSHARIARVYYGASDPKGGAVEHGPRFFAQPTCHHRPEVYSGIGEGEASALLRQFFAVRR